VFKSPFGSPFEKLKVLKYCVPIQRGTSPELLYYCFDRNFPKRIESKVNLPEVELVIFHHLLNK